MTSLPPPPPPPAPPGSPTEPPVPAAPARKYFDLEPSDKAPLELTAGQSAVRLGLLAAAILALGVFYSWWAVAFVAGLLVCIFLHEVGHYVAAKRAGMKVTQFFMFFGPRIWSFKRGETEFGIRSIPAGAFVKVPGMHNLDTEVEPGDEPRTYRAAPFHSRLAMASAGSLMHFAIALICLFIAFAAFGRVTRVETWAIRGGDFAPATDSPAAQGGLQAGDRIVSIDGNSFSTFEQASAYWRGIEGQTASFVVDRNGSQVTQSVLIGSNPDPCRQGGYLGVGPDFDPDIVKRDAAPRAVQQSFTQFGVIAKDSVLGLGRIFSPSGLQKYGKALTSECSTDDRFVSPVGFAKIGSQVAQSGWGNSLLFFAAVNIFIGLFNWFPLLPFDGGHMAIAVYEKIRGRRNKGFRADISRMLPVSYAVFIVMTLLTLGNTYLDIFRGVGG